MTKDYERKVIILLTIIAISVGYLAISRYLEMRMWDNLGNAFGNTLQKQTKQFKEAQKKLDLETQKSLGHTNNMKNTLGDINKTFGEQKNKLETVPQINTDNVNQERLNAKEKLKDQMQKY